jgi:hypothetical protein
VIAFSLGLDAKGRLSTHPMAERFGHLKRSSATACGVLCPHMVDPWRHERVTMRFGLHGGSSVSQRPEHATGEIVILGHGNFLENREAKPKFRPGLILVPGGCCHVAVPLTGKATFQRDGQARRLCPAGLDTGLCGPSYFWSPRANYISRLDVRHHIGWADLEMIDAVLNYMHLNSGALQAVMEYRHSLGSCSGRGVA